MHITMHSHMCLENTQAVPVIPHNVNRRDTDDLLACLETTFEIPLMQCSCFHSLPFLILYYSVHTVDM